jgi:hypothetical protein
MPLCLLASPDQVRHPERSEGSLFDVLLAPLLLLRFPFAVPHLFRKIFPYRKCRGSSPVERGPEKAGVGSSTLPLGTIRAIRT